MLHELSQHATEQAHEVPLCVDLDGTLVRSDMFVEGLLAALRSPRSLLDLSRSIGGGRAGLKKRVAELTETDPQFLPYNEQLIAYLREQKALGRQLVLATAADSEVAHKIADHLGIFDEVISSDGITNLKGETKAQALEARFGKKNFAFVGGDDADLPALIAAKSIVLVNAPDRVRRASLRKAVLEAEFNEKKPIFRSLLKAMRPYQWVKNFLVFVPMLTAHALLDAKSWVAALLLLGSFCATASSIYIFNDLTDLAEDRRHSRKRSRPFASGALSVKAGLASSAVLLVLGLVLGGLSGAGTIVVLYAIASILYSWILKVFPLVDVFMLAGLYTIRLLGGGIATGHPVSPWLLGFSGFLFLSLALVKRTEELGSAIRAGDAGGKVSARRGYYASDLQVLQLFGCASAFAASVVLALFVGSTAASAQYSRPEALWAIVPLILFWECRIWLSASRGYMHDDPIVYAARDWVSWLVAAFVIILGAIAI